MTTGWMEAMRERAFSAGRVIRMLGGEIGPKGTFAQRLLRSKRSFFRSRDKIRLFQLPQREIKS